MLGGSQASVPSTPAGPRESSGGPRARASSGGPRSRVPPAPLDTPQASVPPSPGGAAMPEELRRALDLTSRGPKPPKPPSPLDTIAMPEAANASAPASPGARTASRPSRQPWASEPSSPKGGTGLSRGQQTLSHSCVLPSPLSGRAGSKPPSPKRPSSSSGRPTSAQHSRRP